MFALALLYFAPLHTFACFIFVRVVVCIKRERSPPKLKQANIRGMHVGNSAILSDAVCVAHTPCISLASSTKVGILFNTANILTTFFTFFLLRGGESNAPNGGTRLCAPSQFLCAFSELPCRLFGNAEFNFDNLNNRFILFAELAIAVRFLHRTCKLGNVAIETPTTDANAPFHFTERGRGASVTSE